MIKLGNVLLHSAKKIKLERHGTQPLELERRNILWKIWEVKDRTLDRGTNCNIKKISMKSGS